MKKAKIIHLIEYLSAALSLSYFFVHNIFLVLIGITFSLYLINSNYIHSLIRSINNRLLIKKFTLEVNKNDKTTESNSIIIESNLEDTKLTLVETIEELGFIPSIDKDDYGNVA